MTADSASFAINTAIPTGVPPGFPTTNLNLQQTIFLIDKRVSFLESSLHDTRTHVAAIEQSVEDIASQAPAPAPPAPAAVPVPVPASTPTPVQVSHDALPENVVVTEELEEAQLQLRGEFMERFDLLAAEVGELKDIVMKLQAFTLDINRSLLDRIGLVQPSASPLTTSENGGSGGGGGGGGGVGAVGAVGAALSSGDFAIPLPTFSLSNFVSTTAPPSLSSTLVDHAAAAASSDSS